MTVELTRLQSSDAARLEELLQAIPRLPLVNGYNLAPAAVRRYLVGELSQLLDLERSGVLAGQDDSGAICLLGYRPIEWESAIYGTDMGRVPWILTAGDYSSTRSIAAELLVAVEETCRDHGLQHLSTLVRPSSTGFVHALEAAGWRLVDSSVEFAWEHSATTDAEMDPSVRIRAALPGDREALVGLARSEYTSTIQTRWSADPWLSKERTGDLYARWFELACEGEFGDIVAVAEVDGEPVGFNTLKLEHALSEAVGVGFAAHGIAAVRAPFRGLGTQSGLLHFLTEWLGERGGRFTRGRVLTDNYAMQRACLRAGGFIGQAFHSFHRWIGG